MNDTGNETKSAEERNYDKTEDKDTSMPAEDKSNDETKTKKPTCIIVLGMAGSGKTTFVRKIVSTLYETGKPYVINLDPACKEVPYPTNIGEKKNKSFSLHHNSNSNDYTNNNIIFPLTVLMRLA